MTPLARAYDPYNPHPPGFGSTVDCRACGVQPVFDNPVTGPRCARCGSPAPVIFTRAPPAP